MNATAQIEADRKEYCQIRREVLAVTKGTIQGFDADAKKLALEMARHTGLTPALWLQAATIIHNTTVPCKDCGITKCPDGCCCGC